MELRTTVDDNVYSIPAEYFDKTQRIKNLVTQLGSGLNQITINLKDPVKNEEDITKIRILTNICLIDGFLNKAEIDKNFNISLSFSDQIHKTVRDVICDELFAKLKDRGLNKIDYADSSSLGMLAYMSQISKSPETKAPKGNTLVIDVGHGHASAGVFNISDDDKFSIIKKDYTTKVNGRDVIKNVTQDVVEKDTSLKMSMKINENNNLSEKELKNNRKLNDIINGTTEAIGILGRNVKEAYIDYSVVEDSVELTLDRVKSILDEKNMGKDLENFLTDFLTPLLENGTNIDQCVIVGGSSHLVYFQETIKKALKKMGIEPEIKKDINATEAPAEGASLIHMLKGAPSVVGAVEVINNGNHNIGREMTDKVLSLQ